MKTNRGASRSRKQEGMIVVPGGKVWYQVLGAKIKGVPLLILHGGPGEPHDYLEPLGALGDERPVIFYDQLGCGNSDKPDDKSLWNIQRFVEELAVVRESLELEKVHLLGHSYGTLLAVDYMLTKRPKGVVSMVLSGPFLSASRWTADTRAYLKRMPKKTRETISKCEAAGIFDSPEYLEAMRAFAKRHICRLDPRPDCIDRGFKKFAMPPFLYMLGPSEFAITGSLKGFERVDRLKEIKVPVLFTAGQFDEASPRTTRYYQRMLPGSEIHILKEASHMHHVEREEEYLKTIRDFLHRSERREK